MPVEFMVSQHAEDRPSGKMGPNPCQALRPNINVAGEHPHIHLGEWNINRTEFQMKITKHV
jgi:hypothetical protein